MRELVTGAKGQLGAELLAFRGGSHVVGGVALPEADITRPDAWRAAGPSASPMFPLPSR